ncbi:MAG TPA: hypothetical protein VGN64_02115 [Dyadobacter sp.]|jgi:hypothetical protein|nr:hypothetical protein [Dyadobacter sp.]
MSTFRNLIIIAAFAGILLTTQSFGQTNPEVLTNQSIIALSKAGLDKSVIITTINNAENKFDVSSTMLINLKKQGVANEVISAMVENARPAASTKTAAKEKATSLKPNPEKMLAAKIELINHPYLLIAASKDVKPLEKNIANTATKLKAFGYGGATAQYEIAGVSAGIRTQSADSLGFLVNTGAGAPEFVLFKTKIEKGKRTAAHFSAKPTGGAKSGNNTISCNIFPAGNGVYKLVPSQKLEKGEYFFAGKPNGSANSIDVYAFAVD